MPRHPVKQGCEGIKIQLKSYCSFTRENYPIAGNSFSFSVRKLQLTVKSYLQAIAPLDSSWCRGVEVQSLSAECTIGGTSVSVMSLLTGIQLLCRLCVHIWNEKVNRTGFDTKILFKNLFCGWTWNGIVCKRRELFLLNDVTTWQLLFSGGSRICQGAQPIIFPNFRNLHENEENLAGRASKICLCGSTSATDRCKLVNVMVTSPAPTNLR